MTVGLTGFGHVYAVHGIVTFDFDACLMRGMWMHAGPGLNMKYSDSIRFLNQVLVIALLPPLVHLVGLNGSFLAQGQI